LNQRHTDSQSPSLRITSFRVTTYVGFSAQKRAWFKNGCSRVTGEWGMAVASGGGCLRTGTWQRWVSSVAVESPIAEQLEPVWMCLTAEQFGWTLAHPLGPVTTGETPMVQVEPQQIQVSTADLTAQEEVAAQTAVEILDERTGPRGLGHCHQDGLMDRIPSVFEDRLPLGRPLPGTGPSFAAAPSGPPHSNHRQKMKNRRHIGRYSVEPSGFLSYPRVFIVDLLSGSGGIPVFHQFTHPYCYPELHQARNEAYRWLATGATSE
jgi:hypothetical protein